MTDRDRTLAQLTLAEGSFVEALAIIEHLASISIDPGSHLFTALFGGAIVSYWRPFGQNYGIGKLPEEFSQFDDPNLATIHERIDKSRNKSAAHYDQTHFVGLHQSGQLLIDPLTVKIQRIEGKIYVGTTNTFLHPANIPSFAELCLFQHKRVSEALQTLAATILEEAGSADHLEIQLKP